MKIKNKTQSTKMIIIAVSRLRQQNNDDFFTNRWSRNYLICVQLARELLIIKDQSWRYQKHGKKAKVSGHYQNEVWILAKKARRSAGTRVFFAAWGL